MNNKQHLIILFTLFLTACSSTHTIEKRVTQDNYKKVSIAAEPLDSDAEPFRFWPEQKFEFLLSEKDGTTPLRVSGERLNILALSGGGANGAFGAGVINGLYDSGQLEQYTIITGISAGSLIAPFVFAGGDNIPQLKRVMLGINDEMVLGNRNFLNALIKDAFTSGEELLEFISQVYTPEMIEQIAQQHQSGRRLLIGTTHFDSEELVIWNLGQIAQSDLPNKHSLIHQILAASSSIPGVFPPQFINVNYQGKQYEELHVDGGMAAQMFFKPNNLDYSKLNKALGLSQPPRVDVVRNGALKAPYETLPDKGVPLLSRSISGMIVQQTRGDLYRMLYFSELNDLDLSFTYVDDSFDGKKKTKQMFEIEYMEHLYRFGYNKAAQGMLWSKEMP
ncbi:hypothetical protein GCM10007916_18530 [Psychromonas marina]|uniref:PNPLA domain-containing protein n=1 Tax=Psychromonas marina TaxID=88364 RepID=A0ABQ6E098_9GAMM|nr:patatin-like phospholipase family protein [Psychromonas marina]GLS90786.1 hypothetical protein GCM10007916_18530 [Psychromonas marina]